VSRRAVASITFVGRTTAAIRGAPPLDNLTHALAGAAIAKAGADRATPLATATLVVAANAPDIDMVSYMAGPYAALAFRRGITHGWPALIVLPFLVAGAVLLWDRRVRRRRNPDAEPSRAGPLLALAVVGVLTHPTLDWMNTYGMRWGLPFDGTWTYGDALFIIDPWIWLALAGAVVLSSDWSRAWLTSWTVLAVATSVLVLTGVPAARVPWLVGLAAVTGLFLTHRPATARARRATAGAATAAVCAYIVALVAAGGVARDHVAEAAAARGLVVRDVMVAPLRGNPFVSDVEVVTDEAYVPGVHRWVGNTVELYPDRAAPLLDAPEDLPAAEAQRVLARAREHSDVRHYLVWSRYPYARIEADGAGWQVVYADARYDDAPEGGSLSGVRARVASTP
jgi:inner membrane protein